MTALSPAAARDLALAVAAEASALVLAGGATAHDIRTKGAVTDLVTEWDTRLEALIVGALSIRSPGVAIVAEEGSSRPGLPAHGRWVVDPIDGTVNFAHGL